MGEPGNWGIQRGSKILGPALRGMKFKAGGGSDVGEMARRGEQAQSYQGGRGGEEAETSDPSLQPISPKTPKHQQRTEHRHGGPHTSEAAALWAPSHVCAMESAPVRTEDIFE